MTGVRVFRTVLAQGGKVEWDPSGNPHLRIPPSAHPLIRPHRAIIREILRRAAILREQALQFIPKGIPMPLLALSENQGGEGCLSCGSETTGGRYRCELCAVAVALALAGLRYSWSWKRCCDEHPRAEPDLAGLQRVFSDVR